jgi:hypothetical protein
MLRYGRSSTLEADARPSLWESQGAPGREQGGTEGKPTPSPGPSDPAQVKGVGKGEGDLQISLNHSCLNSLKRIGAPESGPASRGPEGKKPFLDQRAPTGG